MHACTPTCNNLHTYLAAVDALSLAESRDVVCELVRRDAREPLHLTRLCYEEVGAEVPTHLRVRRAAEEPEDRMRVARRARPVEDIDLVHHHHGRGHELPGHGALGQRVPPAGLLKPEKLVAREGHDDEARRGVLPRQLNHLIIVGRRLGSVRRDVGDQDHAALQISEADGLSEDVRRAQIVEGVGNGPSRSRVPDAHWDGGGARGGSELRAGTAPSKLGRLRYLC
mmetsp:Transcript_57426/g.161095  ORF Transcript_57426/g.161095 Transcript_57426/m.161095 type:complete len:226 (+) Transcript_57426:2-679(+)